MWGGKKSRRKRWWGVWGKIIDVMPNGMTAVNAGREGVWGKIIDVMPNMPS